MDEKMLASIQARNDQRRLLKSNATPGPWYVRLLDDDQAMNLVAVSTYPDRERQERWPNFNQGEIVAATLVQTPPYVEVSDDRWEENARFIAFARNDDAEDDIVALLVVVQQLREQVKRLEGKLEHTPDYASA